MKILNKCYIFSKLPKVGLGRGRPRASPRGPVQLKLALDPSPIGLVQAGPACGQSRPEIVEILLPMALGSLFLKAWWVGLGQKTAVDS